MSTATSRATASPAPGGHALQALLVANRGEIARRVFRTARRRGIRCIAVFVDADVDAPFVTEADLAVRLPTSYLDGDAILAAARTAGADGIHPGYGFLSENADFARSVIEAGLRWVGPSPDVIETMGDKIAAKEVAVAAGVPVLASTDALDRAEEVGYPLLVKAAAGGGGKGMRLVASADELPDALAAARREAASSFGDDRVFLERFVARARHIEIQILGDHHDNIVHLGERECSIQRRHQKIIEEAPSSAVDPQTRERMGQAALALARATGYRSAGTVEFLFDDDTGEFFFLEVNTRLQVEHPVTEEVTGIDLVGEQLRIAEGEPLGYDQQDITWTGHAIEARLYAEDPERGFLPATGTLVAFAPSEQPSVRWDSGVAVGSVVGVDFDPMLAKVIAHAPTRREAAGRLALALERLHLGGVVTNRDFLADSLRHPAFLSGDTTTDFIDRVAPVSTARPRTTFAAPATPATPADADNGANNGANIVAMLAALWWQGLERHTDRRWGFAPSNWRNGTLPPQRIEVRIDRGDDALAVAYRVERDGSFRFESGSRAVVHRWTPDLLDAEVDGVRSVCVVTSPDAASHRSGEGRILYLQTPSGTATIEQLPRLPRPDSTPASGGLVAPMPGVVLDLGCQSGDRVQAGALLVVLEAMKMEHHITAPIDGTVTEVSVAVGQQVDHGALLLTIEGPDD